jgi:glycerophosphoryl diester phosphodiesterase
MRNSVQTNVLGASVEHAGTTMTTYKMQDEVPDEVVDEMQDQVKDEVQDEVQDHGQEVASPRRNRWPLAGTAVAAICHEGDTSGGAKPSSEAAFLAAVARGFRFIETDVRTTKDGVLLAIHTVSGTQGGKLMAQQTRAEIEQHLGFPLIDLDVMLAAPFDAVLWNLEVKSKADAQALLAWMRKNPQHVDRICVSWGPTVGVAKIVRSAGLTQLFGAATVFELLRGLLLAPLSMVLAKGARPVPRYQCAQYHRIAVSGPLVRYHHARGVGVHAWGVTTRKQMEKLVARGVDGILSTNSSELQNVANIGSNVHIVK